MYLIIDIGNTNIVFAIIKEGIVKEKWRVSTDINRTSDEYFSWLSTILQNKFNLNSVVIGSVVPEVTEEIKRACKNYFNSNVFIINEDIEISFRTSVESFKEVGTDRLVNSLAAWDSYKEPCIL